MTDLTKIDDHLDPFTGDGQTSLRLDVTRPVDVAVFIEALRRRTKIDVQAVLSLGAANRMPSTQHPAVLFVSPGNLNASLVQSLLEQMPQTSDLTNSVPSNSQDAPEILPSVAAPDGDENTGPLLDRLRSGEDLDLSEVNTMLRALLGYSTAATQAAAQEPPEAPAAQEDPEPVSASQDAAQSASGDTKAAKGDKSAPSTES